MIRYIFGVSFKQFSLSFPDVNKHKGVAETAPQEMTDICTTQVYSRGPPFHSKVAYFRIFKMASIYCGLAYHSKT